MNYKVTNYIYLMLEADGLTQYDIYSLYGQGEGGTAAIELNCDL